MSGKTDYRSPYYSDPRTTEELIQLAQDSDPDGEYEVYWEAVKILQHRLPTIIDRIRNLGGNDPARELSATILGQNSVEDKAFAYESWI